MEQDQVEKLALMIKINCWLGLFTKIKLYNLIETEGLITLTVGL